ncbi:MAG: PIN domain-containing protein [Actinomycetota bacterium]
MTIFVDTSAMFSSLDADDAFHPQAFSTWESLVDDGRPLLSSNYVVLECTWLATRRLGIEAVRRFYGLVIPALSIHWVDEELHFLTTSLMLESPRKNISLVDYISFEIMRMRGITDVFTFDRHFKDQGFDVIP